MTDRNLHLFGLLTDVGDDLVEESLIPSTPVSVKKPRRERRRSGDFWNSHLAAAILSGIVALGVLAGIIVAGQQDLTPGKQPGGQSADTRFKPFYVGMPYEDMMDTLDGLLYRNSFLPETGRADSSPRSTARGIFHSKTLFPLPPSCPPP